MDSEMTEAFPNIKIEIDVADDTSGYGDDFNELTPISRTEHSERSYDQGLGMPSIQTFGDLSVPETGKVWPEENDADEWRVLHKGEQGAVRTVEEKKQHSLCERQRRKQTSFTLATKMKILKDMDEKALTKTQVCDKYSISISVLSAILQKRDWIEEAYLSSTFNPDKANEEKGETGHSSGGEKEGVPAELQQELLQDLNSKQLTETQICEKYSITSSALVTFLKNVGSEEHHHSEGIRSPAPDSFDEDSLDLEDICQQLLNNAKVKRRTSRRQSSFTLAGKMKILEEVDKKILKKTQICKKHNISNSTLSTFLKQRPGIEAALKSSTFLPNRKRMRFTNADRRLETRVLAWYKKAKAKNVPVTDQIMMEKAEQIAKSLNIPDFTPTKGWLLRLRTRGGIALKGRKTSASATVDVPITPDKAPVAADTAVSANTSFTADSSAAADTSVAVGTSVTATSPNTTAKALKVKPNERQKNLSAVLRQFSPCNVFLAAETGLLFKCLPGETPSCKGDQCCNGEKPQERLTLLLAANMDGSQRLQPLVVGKAKSNKNFKTLPVVYRQQRRSWMTADIFEEWLISMNHQLKKEKRKIILLINKSPAHPNIQLQNVKLQFLSSPPSANASQTCCQSITRNFKRWYRQLLLQKLAAAKDDSSGRELSDSFTLFDALCTARVAWNSIPAKTLAACFEIAACGVDDSVEKETQAVEENKAYSRLFDKHVALTHLEGVTAEDFLAVDENLRTASASEDAEETDESADEDGDEEVMEGPKLATVSEAQDAVQTLLSYAASQESCGSVFDDIGRIVDFLEKSMLK